jgi:Tfp pilus assembly protein PilN
MAQINLAPGSQYVAVVRRRRRVLYGIAGGLAAVAIFTAVAVSVMVRSSESAEQSLREELKGVETQIAAASEEAKRIRLFDSRLNNVAQLLDKHQVWTPHLQELERLLPPDTLLKSLNGSHGDGTLELAGSTPNIDGVAVALANLANQPLSHTTLFSGGTITNVTREEQTGPAGEVLGARYVFKMNLTF